ncbi:LysE family translocator [Halomonas binhaiensis]|uniref:LysE family translocator n=1 Tax=Halomonas binhaiensis TaxID=2562282 RepID=A0A5C1NEZ4_9GAMM|nr:LysE family translocator [Halomonas binhaiensis]QEM82292.1 LysE family translocator [Halomonas binhaiensis]
MDLHYWVIFVVTVLGVSLIPGPSTLIAFAHGAANGSGPAMFTAIGNATASTLQAIAASAGLGLAITSSAMLFMVIKYAGAAYLVYVGIQIWRTAAQRVSLSSQGNTLESQPQRLFMSGFTVAISNPKAIAFFTAFFPQFLSPAGNSTVQLAIMVILVALSAFIVALFYSCLGAWVRGLALSRTLMRRINKTTGGLFVASGFGLAISKSS